MPSRLRSWPHFLIAPFTTEFRSKVAVLGALTIVCAAWPLLKAVHEWAKSWAAANRPQLLAASTRRPVRGAVVLVLVLGVPLGLGFGGTPARFHPSQANAAAISNPEALPAITIAD